MIKGGVSMSKKLIYYCDLCAANNGLPIQSSKHVKATCQLCNQRSGPMNEAVEEDVIENNISTEVTKIGHFEIKQLPNFLPGMNPKDIHPGIPYKIQSQDLVLYFLSSKDDPLRRKSFITANPKKGEQFITVINNGRSS